MFTEFLQVSDVYCFEIIFKKSLQDVYNTVYHLGWLTKYVPHTVMI